MKRNEAEKLINDWLDQSNEITGRTIIDFVQELGMLPPEIKERSFKIAKNGEMIYAVNEWEE